MKKRGFTLAETLVTLGIIGVIAALTAPMLVNSNRNQVNSSKLSTIVTNVENAFTTAIAQEGVDTLYETRMWTNAPLTNTSHQAEDAEGNPIGDNPKNVFVGELGRYLATNGLMISDQSVATSLYNAMPSQLANDGSRGNAISENTMDSCVPIELNNGAILFIRTAARGDAASIQAAETRALRAGSSMYERPADVFIDVNGKNAPNTVGRDLFRFYVGQNGKLYPYGGRDQTAFDSNGDAWFNTDWSSTGAQGAAYVFTCTDNAKGGEGWGCTGRLISEGYKMNY